jgi:hypothetical protein
MPPPPKISAKPPVIDRVFDELFDPTSGTLRRTVVTNGDLVEAIRWCIDHKGITLSSKNPANFFKDIIRGSGANGMWPQRLKDLGWTARQRTGDGNVFEFVRYALGQTEPFPDEFGYQEQAPRHRIQSLSMQLASKELGRDDETYLIQVAVKLAVIETHFALESPLNIVELSHLQIGIKQRKTEIDSLFSAQYLDATGNQRQLIITVEAKNKDQRVLTDQIKQQVVAAFSLVPRTKIVVPVAMIARNGGIYVIEFRAIERDGIEVFTQLELETQAFYELVPRVKGI